MTSRRARWAIALAILLAATVAAGAALRAYGARFARGVIVVEVRNLLGAEVEIDRLELSFLPMRAIATGVGLQSGGTKWIGADEVAFQLAVMPSLWAGAWVGDLTVVSPVVRFDDRADIWRRLIASARSAGTKPGRSEAPFLPRRIEVRAASVGIEWSEPAISAKLSNGSFELHSHGLVTPEIDFQLHADGEVSRAGHLLAVREVAAAGSLAGARLRLDSFALRSDAATLGGSLSLDGDAVDAAFDGSVGLEALSPLVHPGLSLAGAARIRGTIGGALQQPSAGAELTIDHVRIRAMDLSATGRLALANGAWSLSGVRATAFGGKVEGDARGTLHDRWPFEADARVSDWRAAEFIEMFGPRTPIRGAISGKVRLDGAILAAELRGSATAALVEGSDRVEGPITFAVDPGRATVEGTIGAGPKDTVRTRFETRHGALSGELTGEIESLDRIARLVGEQFAGAGSIRAKFAGTEERPVFEGSADLSGLVVRGLDLGPARGPFSLGPNGGSSSGVVLAGGAVTVSGRLALTGSQSSDLAVVAKDLDMGRVEHLLLPWMAPFGGTVAGETRLRGGWHAPTLDVGGTFTDAVFAGERVGDGKVEVRSDGGVWQAKLEAHRSPKESLSLQVQRRANGEIEGSGRASGLHLEEIHAVRSRQDDLRGRLDVQATLRGTEAHPLGEVTIAASSLAIGERSLGSAGVKGRATADGIVLEGQAMGAVSATATVRPNTPHAFRAEISARDLDLVPLLPKSAADWNARTTARAVITGDADEPLGGGSATIETLTLGWQGKSLRNRGPIGFRIANGAIELPDAAMDGDGQSLRASGHWSRDAADVRLVGRADLGIAETLSEQVASARGQVDFDLAAARRGEEGWRSRGQLTLREGTLDLGLLIGITRINAAVELVERTVEVREISGRVGGGDFRIAGTVSLDRGWNLGWTVRQASLEVPSWLDYRASGNGWLAGDLHRPMLSGDIEVDQAVYDQNVDWAEFLPWFRQRTRPVPGKRDVPLELDLHVTADGGIYVDNDLVQAELRGDLAFSGGASSPVWSGSIDVTSGEFVFRRRRFTITSGEIVFPRERSTNPDLHFHGETHVSTRDAEYQIDVDVSGTADRPRIEFTADDPSLTENDVLALVTFGRTVSQLQSQGASIELGEVLKVTAGSEGSAFEKGIYSLLPIDRIEIEPSFSRGSGASEPRLSLAKDLTGRFSAVLGAGLGSERNQDVGIEYRLTRGLSAQAVWQSQTKSQAGAIGANLKFRVPFRTLRTFSLLPSLRPPGS